MNVAASESLTLFQSAKLSIAVLYIDQLMAQERNSEIQVSGNYADIPSLLKPGLKALS